jgi:WD40 repeat protein
VDARLVTSDEESFQLAHEAVAREWPRLREWLADDVEGQQIMRHVSAAARAWDAMGRPDSELYRGARLSATAQWRESARPVLAVIEASFVDASIEREAADLASTQRQLQQERRSVRRLRWLAGAAASLAVVALVAGTVAAFQVGAANEQAIVEDARRVAALAGAEPEYERALLLAVEAIRLWDGPTTRRMLLDVMGVSPRIVNVTRTSGDVGVQQMSLAPDGSTAVVVGEDVAARVIDLDRHAQIGEYVLESGAVLDAVAAPDGRIALSVIEPPCQSDGWCQTPDLRAVDLDDPGGAENTLTGFDMYVIDIEFSPDRSLAAVIAPLPYMDEPGNIGIWRVAAPDEPMLLRLPDAGSNPGAPNWANAWGRVRFSPDGSRLYASGYGPTAIFDTRTGALVGELGGDGILAVSPDGGSVLIREGPRAVRIVELEDPSDGILLEMPVDVVDGSFSPDGMTVVTTGGDGAWVWLAPNGAFQETLEGHTGRVMSAAFRPTGELVTAGTDGALITWTLGDWSASFRDWRRTGNEVLVPRDDRTLVSERADGTFVGISADPAIWLNRACQVAGRALTEEEWGAVFADRPYDPACAAGAVASSP